eukprot:TRINITY_DN19228_c0_g1_i2.p3 TRINITY_DN19228_c0_g1~~TRINITY_DN19228_c0_g1_i2.p3  ORF type:complete len:124 (+),score=11.90 TRINITY_DN19228_c0_g1_i2:186-557(+)
MALKLKPPYKNWGAADIATSKGFVQTDTLTFNPSLYPGYRHRTTEADAKELDTDSGSASKHLKTLVFKRMKQPGTPKPCESSGQKTDARQEDVVRKASKRKKRIRDMPHHKRKKREKSTEDDT